MSTFTAASSSTVTDLHKRVRYSTGLVLGVDEFEQEQAYLLERDRLHTRTLHGYGVVHGLQFELGETSNELVVTPGLAVVPSGQHVCVGRPQCADLDEWVKAQAESTLKPHVETSGNGPTPVYVVLCYRECETDTVPIPGEPCRSADESAAPSRIAEDFELQLRLTPPAQPSEEATRAFGAFLRRIQVTEHEGRALSEGEFVEKVRGEITRITGQIATEGTSVSPSETEEPIRLPASEAHAFLRRAFRLWSLHAGRGIDTSSNRCGVLAGDDSDCVRLGTVNLTLQSVSNGYELQGVVSGEDISVDNRPVLLETRLLQEYLTHGRLDRETIRRTLATVSVESPDTLRLWFHDENSLELTDDFPTQVEVEVNGDARAVQNSVSSVGGGTNAFDLTLASSVDCGDRIAVDIPLAEVEEQETDLSLLDRLDEAGAPNYLGRSGKTVTAYTVAPVLRLGDLKNVEVERVEEMDSRQVLVGDPDAEAWQNEDHVLKKLSDVADLSPSPDDVLITRDGSEWDSGKLDLNALSDVNTSVDELKAGQVLTYDGDMWRPEPLPSNAEKGLTRIIATSWAHQRTYTDKETKAVGSEPTDEEKMSLKLKDPDDLLEDPQSGRALSLAVAFGTTGIQAATTLDSDGSDDAGLVESQTITPEVFRVFLDAEVGTHVSARLKVEPKEIKSLVRVDIEKVDGDLQIVEGTIGERENVRGAALVLPALSEVGFLDLRDVRFEVELRGDFILDAEGRAIDAEHVRGQLPSGDRPGREERNDENVGVQGGRFESWFQFQASDVPEVDLKKADLDELTVLPNVGSVIGERILEHREDVEEPFTSRSNLAGAIRGLSKSQIDEWFDEWEGRVTPSLPNEDDSSEGNSS